MEPIVKLIDVLLISHQNLRQQRPPTDRCERAGDHPRDVVIEDGSFDDVFEKIFRRQASPPYA
jgi:hypothetical protein